MTFFDVCSSQIHERHGYQKRGAPRDCGTRRGAMNLLSNGDEGGILPASAKGRKAEVGGDMQRRQIVGTVGAVLIAAGMFVPLVSLQMGGVTYLRDGGGDGMMLALAMVSLALAMRNQCAWLLPTAFTVVAVLMTTIRTARFTLVPPGWLPEARPQDIRAEWGSGVVVLGAVLLVVAAWWVPKATADQPAQRLPRNVLLTTFVMAAILIGTVLLWPSGRFILLPQR